MASVVTLVKEIHSVKAFFKARGEQGKVTDAPLQKSFADTLITMLNSIKSFGPAEAAQVVDAMHGCPYGEDQIARISGVIDNKIQHSGRVQPTASGTKQTLKHWWNYLTKSDWDVLRDKKVSLNRKMTTLAERAMTIGCVSPCQQTEKWALAVLMFIHYDELPDPSQLYAKLGDLKHVFAAEKKDLGIELIAEYPEDPNDLPGYVFTAAYADEQPQAVTLKGINTVANALILRSNSNKLKPGKDKGASDKAEFSKLKKEIAEACDEPAPCAQPAAQPAALVASSADPHEMELFYEYQQKLMDYRRSKLKGDSSPARAAASPELRGSLAIHRASDGTMKVEADVGQKVKAELKEELVDESDAESNQLDPFTLAAVASLRRRKETKKAEAKKAATAKKEAASAATAAAADGADKEDTGSTAKKRPAAAGAGKPSKAAKTEVTKTEPTKGLKVVKQEVGQPKVVPKTQIMGAMPSVPKDGSNPSPVLYKKGIIYTSIKSKRFRALADRFDMYTENSRAWGAAKPTAAAWASAVKSIDDRTK